jgi:hypothetical protein
MPGEQLVQLGGGMIGEAAQHVGEPSLWIAAVEFCPDAQDVHRCGLLSATVGSGE